MPHINAVSESYHFNWAVAFAYRAGLSVQEKPAADWEKEEKKYDTRTADKDNMSNKDKNKN